MFGQNACCASAALSKPAEHEEGKDDANCPKETPQRMSSQFQSFRNNRRQRLLAVLLLTALANLGLWFFGGQPAVAGGSAFILLIAAPGLLLVALILARDGDRLLLQDWLVYGVGIGFGVATLLVLCLGFLPGALTLPLRIRWCRSFRMRRPFSTARASG